jgi:hypothetical protein
VFFERKWYCLSNAARKIRKEKSVYEHTSISSSNLLMPVSLYRLEGNIVAKKALARHIHIHQHHTLTISKPNKPHMDIAKAKMAG